MGEQQPITAHAALQAMSEFSSIGRAAFLAKYGFAASRNFFVRDPETGELVDSKALVGAAYGYANPARGALKSVDFSGGPWIAEGMEQLGFEVLKVSSNGPDLTQVIANYLAMLERDVSGLASVASDDLHGTRAALPTQTSDELTLLYRQISGALRRRGLPFLRAFQPIDTSPSSLHELLDQAISGRTATLRRLLSSCPPLPSGPLYQASTQLVRPTPAIITAVTPTLQIASASLAQRLQSRPEAVHELSPRQFEELIAELLRDILGVHIEITPYRRDGGKDLLAYVDLKIGRLLCLIEAKKYRPDRPVEVEVVRALYGVVTAEDASHGTLITTSSFRKGAKQFQAAHKHRLSLLDYTHVVKWIRDYEKPKH